MASVSTSYRTPSTTLYMERKSIEGQQDIKKESGKGYSPLRFKNGQWFFPDGRVANPSFSVGKEEHHRELFVEYERSFGRGNAFDVTHAHLGTFGLSSEKKEAIAEYQVFASQAPPLIHGGSKEQVVEIIQRIKDFRGKFPWLYVDATDEAAPSKTFKIRE